MKKRIYKDGQGRKYVVLSNAGATSGRSRGGLRYCGHMMERVRGASVRNILKGLRWKDGWAAAQKDLDRLAEKNGWEPWYGD